MQKKMADKLSIKMQLSRQAVNKLRIFGFTNVNEENIATDEVYSFYFLKMLKEMLGENSERDLAINQLLQTMNFQDKT